MLREGKARNAFDCMHNVRHWEFPVPLCEYAEKVINNDINDNDDDDGGDNK